MLEDEALELHAVLAHAREAVDAHWAKRHEQGHEPTEVEQTALLCLEAWPRIEYAQFNTTEEGRVGADWLWWFLDDADECFGVLVQAKRLLRSASKWSIDFVYPRGSGLQLRKLLAAADHFELPAAYMLYCGDSAFRRGLSCGPKHVDPRCTTCDRSGVSVLAGPCAKYIVEYGATADEAFRWSMPLEEMVERRAADQPVADINLHVVSEDLRRFLLDPQTGARQVAKRLFQQAAEMRSRHLAAAASAQAPARAGRVFGSTPLDSGHYGLPYYDHILRGLRRGLPDEVRAAVLDGDLSGRDDFNGLDGVVVVHL